MAKKPNAAAPVLMDDRKVGSVSSVVQMSDAQYKAKVQEVLKRNRDVPTYSERGVDSPVHRGLEQRLGRKPTPQDRLDYEMQMGPGHITPYDAAVIARLLKRKDLKPHQRKGLMEYVESALRQKRAKEEAHDYNLKPPDPINPPETGTDTDSAWSPPPDTRPKLPDA